MIPKPFFSEQNPDTRKVGMWLLAVAGLVFLMILVGGATRLTGSGLSMTDWQPISGTLPPLSAADWQAEFEAYQQFPEYQELNSDMTLAEFKGIFWWEYSHRLLGRLIGLAFALPLLFFMARRMIPAPMKIRMFVLLSLGAVQGLLGWYMVQSGLGSEPAVSHLRLLAHLSLALLLLSALLWAAGQILRAPVISDGAGDALEPFLFGFTALVGIQVALGVLVAGLDAGLIYNQWPAMGSGFIPGDLFGTAPWYSDATTVQFLHRITAYLVFLGALGLFFNIRRSGGPRCLYTLAHALLGLVTVQVILGILTLVYNVPVILGVLHQGFGILLFLTALYFLFAILGRSRQ
ncbi:MAG: heme A synthase [Alphaproteobacteria bacterium]|nr:MAG: heme A synthase [Alphaproteobacteria bacterium]